MVKRNIFALVLIVLFVNIVVAERFEQSSSSFVNYQSAPNFQSYYSSGDMRTYWPQVTDNRDSCESRQDFILQVAPGGCQPAVVRSDLLAEQNVPVFCQIDAIQLNPSIDVKEIKSIRFTGEYPEGVIGTGFHPARAALKSRDRLLGSPIINNVGYVVVVLKRNEIEKNLPDSIKVNLSAKIEYDAGNALGVGSAEFILEEISENNWNSEKSKNSFWNGRYYVRLEEQDPNFAVVSIYDGDQKVSTVKVEKGKLSNEVFVPGSYCRAGLQIGYNGLVEAENSAFLEISDSDGTDRVEVYEKSKFLDGRCVVQDLIINNEGTGNVEVKCEGKTLSLSIGKPKVDYKTGDSVIYKGDSAVIDGVISNGQKYRINVTISGKIVQLEVLYSDLSPSDEIVELADEKLDSDVQVEFDKTISKYLEVVEDYEVEVPSIGAVSYGETALVEAIEFSLLLEQRTRAETLVSMLREKYPESQYLSNLENKVKTTDAASSDFAFIDGRFKSIRVVSFNKIGDDSKAKATLGIGPEKVTLLQGASQDLKIAKVKVELTDINTDYVVIAYKCENGESDSSKRIRVGDTSIRICKDEISVNILDIDVKSVAKIRIVPRAKNAGSEVPLTVNIGIEKRAIKLSPERTSEMIDNLNKSIEKFDKISENLGNVVTGLKTACLATGAALTAKNLLFGLSGEALARQEVMRGNGGWTEKCNEEIKETGQTLSQCFGKHSSEIKKDVDAMTLALQNSNTKLKQFESKYPVSGTGILSSGGINRDSAAKDMFNFVSGECKDVQVKISDGESKSVGELLNSDLYSESKQSLVGYEQLRDIYTNCQLLKSGTEVGKSKASASLSEIGRSIEDNRKYYELSKGESGLKEKYGINVADLSTLTSGSVLEGDVASLSENSGLKSLISDSNAQYGTIVPLPVGPAPNPGEKAFAPGYYALGLAKDSGNRYAITKVVKLDSNYVASGEPIDLNNFLSSYKINSVVSSVNYNNKYRDPKVQYYEVEPYKGMPAIVPIDKVAGWYAGATQTLPVFGNTASYQSNGRPASFWICNVGPDGNPDLLTGFGDDVGCVQINIDSGQSLKNIPGASEAQAKQLVSKAVNGLTQAAEQYKSGIKFVIINGERYEVDSPATNVPATQCQDFMSPSECRILFNVCDPVICPSSRCDLGGSYPVADVVQSGIVGSTLLCLPNFPEVAVPVCLTGIKAGLDSYVSILKSHRDCLQENLETGKTVGICDEIYSVYMCDLVWRQAAPAARIAIPKLLEFATGQNKNRGGGEYSLVQSSWNNAEQSVNYMTQSYGINSLKAFQTRNIEETGATEFCKAFISVSGPKGFESLVEPDSPPQVYAWFSSVRYSDATAPATAQYKAFFHIYSGDDSGSYYSVYLKSAPESSFYYIAPTVSVASGFVKKGEYVSETKDFTAPEGYKELCIRVNDKDYCGFGQVTTDFGLNYLRDKATEGDLTETGIVSGKECVSGSPSLASAITPNLQAGVEGVAFPEQYKRGIVRVCASENPGSNTEPGRYVEVGYCDNTKIKCWLDQKSVDNALTDENKGIRNATLAELEQINKDNLNGDISPLVTESNAKLNEIENKVAKIDASNGDAVNALIMNISELRENLVLNHHKARLLVLEARLYAKRAMALFEEKGFSKPDEEVSVEEKDVPSIPGISSEVKKCSMITNMRLIVGDSSIVLPYVSNNLDDDSTIDNYPDKLQIFGTSDCLGLNVKIVLSLADKEGNLITFNGKFENIEGNDLNPVVSVIVPEYDIIQSTDFIFRVYCVDSGSVECPSFVSGNENSVKIDSKDDKYWLGFFRTSNSF